MFEFEIVVMRVELFGFCVCIVGVCRVVVCELVLWLGRVLNLLCLVLFWGEECVILISCFV